jgi:hypothetical protein
MRWISRYDKLLLDVKNEVWKEWFAWYPINIGNVNVFLEKVERKPIWIDRHDESGYFIWEYRTKK